MDDNKGVPVLFGDVDLEIPVGHLGGEPWLKLMVKVGIRHIDA